MSDVGKYSVLTRDRVRGIVIVCAQARKKDCKLSLSMQNSDEEKKHFRLKATPSFSPFNGPQSLCVSMCLQRIQPGLNIEQQDCKQHTMNLPASSSESL